MTELANAAKAITPDQIREEYFRRGLDRLSDLELSRAVSSAVSVPREDAASSFVLHSALELQARLALLPTVSPQSRELARLRIVAIASQYEAAGPPVDHEDPGGQLGARQDPIRWFADARAAGDLHEIDRAAAAIARSASPDSLPRALIDIAAPLTAAAGHSPIFLYHYARLGHRMALPAELLRPLSRELARNPSRSMSWFTDRQPGAKTDPVELGAALGKMPVLGEPGTTAIFPLMDQVDRGPAEEHIGPALGRYTDNAARAVLRVAARSMLEESPQYAPYGWTHCLTMPQAVLGLAHLSADPDRLLAIAATHVAGFRAGEAGDVLADEEPPHDTSVSASMIANAAAISHDAHIVKYVLACLDAAAGDPPAASLFLAAGQRLLDTWTDIGDDPSDPLMTAAPRSIG